LRRQIERLGMEVARKTRAWRAANIADNASNRDMTMQKKTVMLGVGALVVLGAWLAWAFAPRPLQVEAAAMVQSRFEAGIDEDAKTRLRDRYRRWWCIRPPALDDGARVQLCTL
jgi:hypothetical protein